MGKSENGDEFSQAAEIIPGHFYFINVRRPDSPRYSAIAQANICYTIDDELLYEPFFADFGPLNLGRTNRFCQKTKQLLQEAEKHGKKVFLYAGPHAHQKANAAVLLEVCRWFRQQGGSWSGALLDAAAGAGHKAVCEWLLNEVFLVDELTAAAAARGGHVGLMDWILVQTAAVDCLWAADAHIGGRHVLEAAAAGCDLPTLQRLHHTYLDSCGRELPVVNQERVVVAAAGSPTADWRDKVEWLGAQGYPRSELACGEAAERVDGRERLEWLQQQGYLLTAYVFSRAARHGNVDAMEFLRAQGVQMSGELVLVSAPYAAAEGGHLAALKVLHAHGARIGIMTVACAAEQGHLPVVAWLVETLGATLALTASVSLFAAHSGSAELLAWLHQHGCPWNASTFAKAAIAGSEEQLEWLVEHGCPMGDDGAPYRQALGNGDLAMLRCLRRLGCPWGPVGCTFTHAVTSAMGARGSSVPVHLEQLTWLVAQGCPVDWAAAEQEAEQRRAGEVLARVRQLRPQSGGPAMSRKA
ncbi:Ankyrin repeat domain-containing protein [Tetrabaena socialis]|uniref:Ankyrin repeat domain-containing protein n=1 Tax=Tetrabaena socialis TaxID=47790 RepID=A0A2J8AGF1_9CHLO|nr:Ankyrin repeat domain-containing protein [Tetrabaena socialis]|eukprot:PNH11604.1 Ankyrin repeat domain-containing protein [Tetrabaena socialis]